LTPVYLAAAFLMLGAMIVIHEFGHFIVAKFFRIRVEVFSIGFGKSLLSFQRGDTDYRISLIPLGGYVKLAGEAEEEHPTGAPDEFSSKPRWQRLCVLFAGPAMNVLTALLIPAALAMIHYEEPAYMNKPAVVGDVEAGSAADKAGIKPGDLIVKIDGQDNPTWGDLEDRVALNPNLVLPLVVNRQGETQRIDLRPAADEIDQQKVGDAGLVPSLGPGARLVVQRLVTSSPAEQAGLKVGDQLIAFNGTPLRQDFSGRDALIDDVAKSGGNPIKLTVKRDGQTVDIVGTPHQDNGTYRFGFSPKAIDIDILVTRLAPLPALKFSVNFNIHMVWLTKVALGQVFTGKRSAKDTLAGPIQILQFASEAAKEGIGPIFQLMALLSLNLGVFNLLPIPVLDGGTIFTILLEGALGLVGVSLTTRVQERMKQAGLVFLVVLMAFVIINDLRHVIPGKSDNQQTQQQSASPGK
jgi:regulator of sigma E protease